MTATEAKATALQALKTQMPWPAMNDWHGDIDDFLPEDEAVALILNLAHTRGDAGFSEDEVAELLTEAATTRMRNTVLDMALKGVLNVNVHLESEIGNRITYTAAPEYLDLIRHGAGV